MTLYYALSLLARLLGFTREADQLWERHEAKARAREVADAPATRAELEKTLEDGKL